jgi:hypothetical protein
MTPSQCSSGRYGTGGGSGQSEKPACDGWPCSPFITVIPAQAGTQGTSERELSGELCALLSEKLQSLCPPKRDWVPASAGMTLRGGNGSEHTQPSSR